MREEKLGMRGSVSEICRKTGGNLESDQAGVQLQVNVRRCSLLSRWERDRKERLAKIAWRSFLFNRRNEASTSARGLI